MLEKVNEAYMREPQSMKGTAMGGKRIATGLNTGLLAMQTWKNPLHLDLELSGAFRMQ